MTYQEAQRAALRIYNGRYLREAGGLASRDDLMGGLRFFGWLRKHYPEVLNFPCDGDPYQEVKCWIGMK